MITEPDSPVRRRAHRGVGVVVLAVLVVVGGLVLALPFSGSAGADPSEPTAVPPTQPATVPPTASPTQPPQTADPTPATSVAPATSSPSSWDRNPSSGGSSGQGQQPETSAASQNAESAAGAAPAVETTTPSMTTTQDLLVGPSTTRPAPTTVVPRDATGSSVTTSGGSSDPKIWAIVAALAVVAVALGIATFLYWRRTRPGPVEDDGDADERGRRSGSRKRSRYADLVVSSPEPR